MCYLITIKILIFFIKKQNKNKKLYNLQTNMFLLHILKVSYSLNLVYSFKNFSIVFKKKMEGNQSSIHYYMKIYHWTYFHQHFIYSSL